MVATKEIEKLVKQKNPPIEQLTAMLQDLVKERDRLKKRKVAPDSAAAVKAEKRHMDCLKASLQAAVTLEFATIPPYLCSLWSIKNDVHPVANSIREVVQEEMLHMALAANMLASIGVEPKITDAVPAYPSHLPGNVHPDLVVGLSGLTLDALKAFLNIELPHTVFQLEPDQGWQREVPQFNGDATIGAFYQAIEKSFVEHPPEMSPDRQVSGPLAWTVVRNVSDAAWAIELISRQGEGSTASPFDRDSNDLAHFYRFLEIYLGNQLAWRPDTKTFGKGTAIEFPDVWKMAVVPEGGYQEEHLEGLSQADKDAVQFYLAEFDKTYTKLLDQLQGAWRLGGQASLIHAYETMFDLEKYARPLMQIEIPGADGQTYGPCFRYTPLRRSA